MSKNTGWRKPARRANQVKCGEEKQNRQDPGSDRSYNNFNMSSSSNTDRSRESSHHQSIFNDDFVSNNEAHYWVRGNSRTGLPNDVLLGGVDNDGKAFFIGRAMKYHEHYVPIKFTVKNSVCNYQPLIGDNDEFDILCERKKTLRWEVQDNGFIPKGSVQGGWTDDSVKLFICRINRCGTYEIGSVNKYDDFCTIGYGRTTFQYETYEILRNVS
ncbi:PREDICTED: uncharacterized protein LOC108567406 [Nicrophorus vespilloides]|uniref:Uncharacterized protein LOC108567406 n=1 Tax=Nicrophorus vespilloides TaxID=110193 RepID=A0ABM1N927_NICVS|nr:PREDICTED: uncharacterized protein LOC108567406 [Nicrophorus vespilloides]